MSDQEAIVWLLQRQQPSSGLSQFVRILLALEVETWLAERAKENQKIGGELKGSSNLTEARVDVRKKLAEIAGASTGNVTKVKVLKAAAHPSIIEALKAREVSIHRAWLWVRQSSDGGKDALDEMRSHRGIHETISKLIRRHRKKPTAALDGLQQIRDGLRSIKRDSSGLDASQWADLLRELAA